MKQTIKLIYMLLFVSLSTGATCEGSLSGGLENLLGFEWATQISGERDIYTFAIKKQANIPFNIYELEAFIGYGESRRPVRPQYPLPLIEEKCPRSPDIQETFYCKDTQTLQVSIRQHNSIFSQTRYQIWTLKLNDGQGIGQWKSVTLWGGPPVQDGPLGIRTQRSVRK